MNSNDIRKTFLDFFEKRGHRVVRSSSLVPANDPTLLFTNAGMNQFKDVFLGREKRDYVRACSAQKCLRAGGKHNDLEQVGRTRSHLTFFEMLGNFSFGDYFKKEAIPWAWELITKEFAIPRKDLYVTIFLGSGSGPDDHDVVPRDEEAHDIWVAQGLAEDRIVALGLKDNFWQMGDTGPCGPCSEILYDLGPRASEEGHADCKIPCDCGRYVEIWNLVFMQFNRDESGKLAPLPRPSIDTGAGLDRLTAVLQGKLSVFETDLFQPLIEEAASLANVEYGANHDTDVSLRIIADHARAATFLIADGVLPSNEGRGYVLRLILRRALYHGQTLKLNDPFLYKLSGHVVEMMKGAYPELADSAHHAAKAIKDEEERYAHTTRLGLEHLGKARVIAEELPDQSHLPAGMVGFLTAKRIQLPFSDWKRDFPRAARRLVNPKIDGADLFRLHDTFGLRPDFVEDIVGNYGLTVDREGYEAEMQKQRERARASWKAAEKKIALPIYQELAEKHRTVFEGYERTASRGSKIIALIENGKSIEEISARDMSREVEIVLDRTPFYAEAGGQVGDSGRLFAEDAGQEVAYVNDTYYPVGSLIAHKALVRAPLRVGQFVAVAVDAERRDSIRRNHTATHLLHAALRHTLGTHVKQAGSLVAPDRLRFDFTHYAPLDQQDLLDIEDLVNRHVLENEEVRTDVMNLDAAVNSGAMALFGEKYADRVRVVSIADFSKELCGGTHVRRTGDIGLFKVIAESSVAAGTRRIEALTGQGVLKQLREASETLALLAGALRAKPGEVVHAAEKLAESEKKLRKQLEAQQLSAAASQVDKFISLATTVKGIRVISQRIDPMDRDGMRQLVDRCRAILGSGVVVLGNTSDDKVALIVAVSKDLTNRLDAGKIVKEAAGIVEGTGGGRRDLAEAGGKNPDKLDASLQAVPSIVEKML